MSDSYRLITGNGAYPLHMWPQAHPYPLFSGLIEDTCMLTLIVFLAEMVCITSLSSLTISTLFALRNFAPGHEGYAKTPLKWSSQAFLPHTL